MKRKLLPITFGLILLGIVAVYVFASSKAYDTLSLIRRYYTPVAPSIEYEDVTFPSRGQDYKVHAFYFPGNPDYPVLINVPGRFGSRHSDHDMPRAVAWHELGYNVLSLDLADNGGDTVEDNRFSLGYDEQNDILGAIDYLFVELGYNLDRIGLVGLSNGASSSLMAAGIDSRIKAVWADSGYTRADSVISEQAMRNGFTPLIVPGGFAWGALTSGDRIWEVTPIEFAAKLAENGQAVYIVHSESDETVSYHHGVDLYERYKAAGVDVTFWSVTGVKHGDVFNENREEYIRRLDEFFKSHLTFKDNQND